jgi:hypothetical protein
MENQGTKEGSMEIKNYQIKIYRHYDNEVRQVADCSVKLTIPPKIEKCTGENLPNNVREAIEATLETELKLPPPNGGAEAILNHYKPLTPQHPVGGPIVDDYSWTIE